MRSHPRFKHNKKNIPAKKKRGNDLRDNAKKLPRNSTPITVQITHIGSRGDGVGRADYTLNYTQKSYTVFVPETLPGEVVTAQPQQINAQGIRAELIELNQASDNRRTPRCPALWRLSTSASKRQQLSKLEISNLGKKPFRVRCRTERMGERLLGGCTDKAAGHLILPPHRR